MAIKRNSRAHSDETNRNHHYSQEGNQNQHQMASAYISRRSSWNSLKDDLMHAVQDLEAGQMSGAAAFDSPVKSSAQHRTSNSSTEIPLTSTLGKTPAEKSSNFTSLPPSPSSSSFSDSSRHPKSVSNNPPANFGTVIHGVYRSSYPTPEDFPYLSSLKLKTVVTLVKKDHLDHNLISFVNAHGINQVIFNMKGTKKEAIPLSTMRSILELVLDPSHYPLLVHCNHGKHRTGCVVAAMRKLAGWQLRSVLDEYKTYAAPKVRDCDVEYIHGLECSPLQKLWNGHGHGHTRTAARFTPVQVRTFFRALLFSSFVMVLWLVSGSRMPRIDDVRML
ncbi:hypothetical protein E4U13_004596 [Claviceps humidiphila]|uniref:diphosphoinositol-polyphosphate diphosphatase n=1 Tax=Claviceps humidiphila TaxID=1294629 RepID=A0A9P7TP09_9HYPO|nr:hypothetical protein E4U13_004596 [Claviceps humidiphila]